MPIEYTKEGRIEPVKAPDSADNTPLGHNGDMRRKKVDFVNYFIEFELAALTIEGLSAKNSNPERIDCIPSSVVR